MLQDDIHIVDQAPMELLERLACLHDDAFRQLGQKGWGADQIGFSLEQSGCKLVFTKVDDQIAGLALYKTVLDEAELFTLAVNPAHQRVGVASDLLNTIRIQLEEEGVASFFLEVRSDNIGAVACYKKLGFETIAVRKNYYTDDSGAKFDANIMQLPLRVLS